MSSVDSGETNRSVNGWLRGRFKRLYQNLERPASPVSTALLRRHARLQLLEPVLDDDDRRISVRSSPFVFQHQEPLAVRGDIVLARDGSLAAAKVSSRDQPGGCPG